MNKFGIRLKELRGKKSINEFVKDLNQKYDTTISKSMISRYENGKADPSMEIVRIIAHYFDVSLDYLMGLEDKEGPKTIAAHHDNEDWTEEELEEIEKFKDYVRSKRNKGL